MQRYSTSIASSPTFALTDFELASTSEIGVPVSTFIPCFLNTRSTTRTTSLSSAGRICGSISISVTSVP
jgi:hypothetical protein